ncbi:MAG: LON peptidase substrate-binding domain-containing protein [Planctomycetota bacterium]|nr:LON peptidase substrate-binding domain-containing protein [Planctomycetota bacterium]
MDPERLPPVFEVPLFPLPDVVLFPGMILPLHIFEPRYKRMLSDAMAGERLIAMARLKPGWQQACLQAPEIFGMVGVGRIVAHQKLQDGTFHIALMGLGRARVQSEVKKEPYRVATVASIGDRPADSPESTRQRKAVHESLVVSAESLMRRVLREDARKQLSKSLSEREDVGGAADLLASVFIQDPDQRQDLLDTVDPLRRARFVEDALDKFAAQLEPTPPPLTGRLDDFNSN